MHTNNATNVHCISTPLCRSTEVPFYRFKLRPRRNVTESMLIDDNRSSSDSHRHQFCKVPNNDDTLMPMLDSLSNTPHKAPLAIRPRTLSAEAVSVLGFPWVFHSDAESDVVSVDPFIEEDYYLDSRCSLFMLTPKRASRNIASPPPLRRLISPSCGHIEISQSQACKLPLLPDDF